LTDFAPHFQDAEFIGKHARHRFAAERMPRATACFTVFEWKIALPACEEGVFAGTHKPL
jgi:hypothetical protein